MSLLVWLPLNGNLNNQGISPANFNIVNNNAGILNTGVGKTSQYCYQRTLVNTVDYITSDINFILDGDVTMACWCKITNHSPDIITNGIITQHGHMTGGLGITMKYISDTDYRMSVNTGLYGDSHGNLSDRTYQNYYGSTNIYNTWHHLCLTYNNKAKQLKIYVDGKLENIEGYGNFITLAGNNTTARPFRIFDWSTDFSHEHYYKPACLLNDVRLYDECLSSKEIKLLSQGLIAHYQLKGMGRTNYLKGAFYTKENPLIRNANDVSHIHDSYTYHNGVLSITVPKDGTYSWILECDGVPTSHPTSGTSGNSRYFSMWVQNTSTGNYYLWTNFGTGPDGRHYGQVTIPAGTYNVRTNLYAADGINYTIKFWDIKFVYGFYDVNDLWCPHMEDPLYESLGIDSFICSDSSGHGNNLTKTGTIYLESSKARYSSCIDFNQTGYLKKTDFNMNCDKFTIAFWLNPPYTINGQHFICGTFNNQTGNGFGMWRDSTGAGYSALLKSNNEGSHTSLPFCTPTFDDWNHIAYVYNGTQGILYKNGEEVNRVNGGLNGMVSHPVLYLGNSMYNGTLNSEIDEALLSDFRFYCTALTNEDINNLYITSASITKNGDLLAYEFKEKANKVNINKQGIFSGYNLNECNQLIDTQYMTLDDNSIWAKIFYHKNNQGSILFTSYNEVMNINTQNKFSLLYLLDNLKGKDGKYEFILKYPSYSNGYNRWKQKNNPCKEFIIESDGSANVEGYEPIKIDFNTNFWGGLARQNIEETNISPCFISGSIGHGNWFHAIGSSTAWESAIPGPNAPVNETELWVRVDTLPKNVKMSIVKERFISSASFQEM